MSKTIFTSGTYVIADDLMYSSYVYQDSIFIICDTSISPVNIILPRIDKEKSFSNFIFISDASENAYANNITISSSVGQTINNSASVLIDVDGGSCFCIVSSSSLTQIAGQLITSKWVALQSNQSGGGGSYTSNNGLNLVGSTFKLGGTLLANTTILNNGFDFVVSRADTGNAIRGLNTTGVGARGDSTSNVGVYGNSATNTGVFGNGLTGGVFSGSTIGMSALSISGLSIKGRVEPASTSTVVTNMVLERYTSGGGAINGIGQSFDFTLQTSSSADVSNKLISKWTNATHSSRTSQFEIEGYYNAVYSRLLALAGQGNLILDKYGIGTFVGTPTYLLGVNASGNVVETTSIAARNYGSFYDTTNQIASGNNQVDAMKLNSTDSSATNGISIVNDSFGNPTKITVTKTSIYNIQFSAQLSRTTGGTSRQISIWLRKNGLDMPSTNTHISVQANANKLVAAWNFFVSLNAGDNVQLMWSVQDVAIQILYEAENLSIPHPATPSLIATITEV